MSTESIEQKPGFYGKVPTHGDFVKHHLPRSFIDPWDNWLQASLHQSKTALGSNWLDAYLTSPIYRFVLTPGICGNHQWMGVIMPSVDSIGRYFPLTLCMPVSNKENCFQIMERRLDWFTNAESLVMTCLEDSFNFDAFIHHIENLGEISGYQAELEKIELPGTITGDPILVKTDMNQSEHISDYYPEIINEVLRQSCFAYSLWSTKGSADISPGLVSQGLPLSDYFSSFCTGNWENHKENILVHDSE